MKFRFTIGGKLYTGFGVIILCILLVFLITNQTLTDSRRINDRINEVYIPSVQQLEKLRYEVIRTRMLITNWAFVQSREDTEEKRTLKRITEEDLPEIIAGLNKIALAWDENDVIKKNRITKSIDELLKLYEIVKKELPDMRSYDEDFNVFYARDLAEEGGVIDEKAKEILFDLNNLIIKIRKSVDRDSAEMHAGFDQLQVYLRSFGIGLFLGGILIALLTGRSIVRPVRQLKTALLSMGRGVVPKEPVKITRDEIGEMAQALNTLIDSVKHTTEFAEKVGQGNFDYPYQPLSNEDKLGAALLKMARELGDNERNLERQVRERTQEVVEKSHQIEELYQDVTASIRSAKRLQETILPPMREISTMFPDSFVFYKPRDIVSGDFYWFRQLKNKQLFAVVDSTGHGVPGAFMSLVGFNGLNQAVKDNEANLTPQRILSSFHLIAQQNLHKTNEENNVSDSMDMALCVFDTRTRTLEYAGANIQLYLVRNGALQELKPNKCSIGGIERDNVVFEQHTVPMLPGDKVYLFSDGFVDQFGGPKGRKFMYKQFRSMILSAHHLPMEEQQKEFMLRLDTWMEGHPQVDDILMVGVGF
ncbi:MAG: HAMP domain-containing protein [Cryomorphaceae bacterium]|nr:MAG: HAMP domain-containing protein [Cryomorphaceae bacterium]